jgi:AAA15 family ATPase/GTPase
MIEFRVGNYRSFKDVVTFSMVAAPIQQTQRDRLLHELELRHRKIMQMRMALARETGSVVKFQLEQQLLGEKAALSKLEMEINEREQLIQHDDKTADLNNVFAISKDISLLRSAAIYGANASGKSNLIRAISFVQNFILNSAIGKRVKDPINTEIYKLSKDVETEPSYFEIIFAVGTTRYRYGFEVDRPQAIKHAKILLSSYDPHDPESDNPVTTVHLLVEELNQYIR